MIVAIDPGVANGYAEFEDDGTFVNMGQLVIDDMLEFFMNYDKPVSTVVIEDYILFRKRAKQQAGSNLPASQVIGAAKMFAKMKGAKFVKQEAGILPIAQKWSQIKMPKDHNESHQISAYNHGYYYLVRNGIRQPQLAEQASK